MDYYLRKQLARQDIDKIIKSKHGFSISLLTIEISKNYGFSRKNVLEFLNDYVISGVIRINNDEVKIL